MAKINVTAYPYATMFGDLEVPDDVINGSDAKLHEYVSEHWDESDFWEPDLDFRGCEFHYFQPRGCGREETINVNTYK